MASSREDQRQRRYSDEMKGVVRPDPRAALSAPGRRNIQDGRAPLPKINTLVTGNGTEQEDEASPKHRTQRPVKPASKPAKQARVEPKKSPKFATDWAGARISFITAGDTEAIKAVNEKRTARGATTVNDKGSTRGAPTVNDKGSTRGATVVNDKDTISKEARLSKFGFSIQGKNGVKPPVKKEETITSPHAGTLAKGSCMGDAAKASSPDRSGMTSPRKKEQYKHIPVSDAAKSAQNKPAGNDSKTMSPVRVSRERTRVNKPTEKTDARISRVASPETGSPERRKYDTPLSPDRERTKLKMGGAATDVEDEGARKRLKRRLSYVVVPPPRREQTRERTRRKKTEIDIPLASSANKPAKSPKTRHTTDDATELYIREYTRAKSKSTFAKSAASAKVKSKRNLNRGTTPFGSQRNLAPGLKKELVLTLRETEVYRTIHSVYDDEKSRKNRLNQFMRKLQRLQLEQWRLQAEEERTREYRKEQKKLEQTKQLKYVREKFDDEQVRRFRNQYVTSRALTRECTTRDVFGLPEDLHAVTEHASKVRSRNKKQESTVPPGELRHRNMEKFKVMFDARHPRTRLSKPPKMEGVDTVIMEGTDSKGRPKYLAIDDVMKDAERMLEDQDTSPGDSDSDVSWEDADNAKSAPQQKSRQFTRQPMKPATKPSKPVTRLLKPLPPQHKPKLTIQTTNRRPIASHKLEQKPKLSTLPSKSKPPKSVFPSLVSPSGDNGEVDGSARNRGEKPQLPDVRIRHVRLMGNVLETKSRTDNDPLHAKEEQHRAQTTKLDESDDRKQSSQVGSKPPVRGAVGHVVLDSERKEDDVGRGSPSDVDNRTDVQREEGAEKDKHKRDRTASDEAQINDGESKRPATIKVDQDEAEHKTPGLTRERDEASGLEEQLQKRERERTTEEGEREKEREREIQQRLALESGRQREYSQSTIDVSCVSLAEKTEEDDGLTTANKSSNDAWISDRPPSKAGVGHSVASPDSPSSKYHGKDARILDVVATNYTKTPPSTDITSHKQRPERVEISPERQIQRPIIKQTNGVASKRKHVTIAAEVKTSSSSVSAVPKPPHKQNKPPRETPLPSALRGDTTRQTSVKRVNGNVKDQPIERTENNQRQSTTKRASTLKTRQKGNELKTSTVNARESSLPVTRPVKETTALYTKDADSLTTTDEESEDDDVFMKAMKKYGIQLDSDSD